MYDVRTIRKSDRDDPFRVLCKVKLNNVARTSACLEDDNRSKKGTARRASVRQSWTNDELILNGFMRNKLHSILADDDDDDDDGRLSMILLSLS